LPPPASAWVYELTPWGLEAEEIVKVIGRWAARSPSHDPTLPISIASIVMSMRTMFAADRAKDVAGRIGFRFGREEFIATLAKGKLSIGRGIAKDADVVVEGDQQALAGAIYGGVPLAQLERAGALRVTGDRALLERYIRLFPLPAKAPDAKALREQG
jgi:alkyl sulfatase BDS1-like metallo-beta-lactamase superfamily hydrolase